MCVHRFGAFSPITCLTVLAGLVLSHSLVLEGSTPKEDARRSAPEAVRSLSSSRFVPQGNGTGELWLFAAGTPCAICPEKESQFDGMALTNFGGTQAAIGLELIQPQEGGGSPAGASTQGGNFAQLLLAPGEQVARLRTDLFGGDASSPAWIELTGDTTSLGTFFQFGTGSLSQLDGGVAITETSTSFTFTRIFDGFGFRGQDSATGLSIFNPNDSPVTLELTFITSFPAGAGPAHAVVEIPARGMVATQPSELFGGDPVGQGLVTGEVTQGGGVVAFELIQLTNRTTILGLNAATGNPGTVVYSAQLANQDGIFTNMNIVNRGDGPRNITLRAIGEDGSSLANPVDRTLVPGEAFVGDVGEFFDHNIVGSLVVEADGDGVVGDVIFGDSDELRFAASLPLQTKKFEEALFNQVANIAGFFTGLAFFYPGESQGAVQGEIPDAEVTIQVFLPDGTLVGEVVQTLAVGERFSRLVSELVEGAVNLGGGYVHIVSTQPVVGQMLFGVVGPQGIQLLSAVPPTVIR